MSELLSMPEKKNFASASADEAASKLVPILREGVEVVKMILFRELRAHLAASYVGAEKSFVNQLAGVVMNELFGTQNQSASFMAFAAANQPAVADILGRLATELAHLRIPVTDALRIMALCDYQEGVDNSGLLSRASDYGILLTEREMPMPHSFIELVRRLGHSYGLLTPPTPR